MKRYISALLLACAVALAGFWAPSPAGAAGRLQVIANVGGQPDDIASDGHGRLVWGDLAHGTVDQLYRGRVSVRARGISVPEGVVIEPDGSLIVAEQGYDRIDRVDRQGRVSVLYRLQPVAGQEGVDGIARDPRNGSILVPDSPHGTLLHLTLSTLKADVLASGMGRPVDAAVDRSGNILLPDEHLGVLVVVSPRGRVTYRGSFDVPDDVAVARHGNVWVTSLASGGSDGGLWLLSPGQAAREMISGLANPQGLTLDSCGNPIVVEQNLGRIVRLVLTPPSRHCSF